MFNIGERESEKEEEKWVGDEIDAMKDNILFFLFSLEKEKFVERRKKTNVRCELQCCFHLHFY